MAISRVVKNGKQRWFGLAVDTKPTASTGSSPAPDAGDPFIETDTGAVYVYTGSAWSASIAGAVVVVDLA
jgi:hypothetical protein